MNQSSLRTFRLTDQTISQSIESLGVFIQYITSLITDYQTGLKNFYNDYLTLVEMKLTPNVTFALFRKADSVYLKLISSLEKFVAALRKDHFETIQLARDLQRMHSERRQLAEQKNDRNKPQLIAKITNISKEFTKLANDYQERINNFLRLQSNLAEQVIVYNSLSKKTFYISLNNDYNEFLDLLGITQESGLLEMINRNFINEFTNKIDSLDDDALVSILPLDSLDPEQNQPNQPTQPRQPTQQQRKHFNLHVVNLVSLINVQDLPRDKVVMIEDDKVIKILLQTVKTQLFNKFNTWQDKFFSLPLYGQFIQTFQHFLLPRSAQQPDPHLELERIARELVEGHRRLSSVRRLYAIDDVVNIDKNDANRKDFLKNWFTWTRIVYLYNCFETEQKIEKLKAQLDVNPHEIHKFKLTFTHDSILIYLYGECLAKLKPSVEPDDIDLHNIREIFLARYKEFVVQKVKVLAMKLKNSTSPSEQLRRIIYEEAEKIEGMQINSIEAYNELQNIFQQ
ncbi:uncharacterized protein LOC141537411 [Cotesia typhae]|uniref:uncharacterized protein LOC141537411 n=1 Tax=Cotesia typhae TaxID=2053667 RepID=UPI003D682E1F